MLWLILGIVIGLGLAYMVGGARSGKIRVLWYQWILGVIAVALLLLAIQNYYGLMDELQPKMANFALIAFGLPGVILAILAVGIPMVFGRKGSSAPASKVKLT